MKLQVTQENLNKALGIVARVASARGTLPILANVLIKTVENRLSISATNLDIAITQHIGAKVAEEGSITVPARLMQDFINSLPAGVIELRLEEHKLHITTDKYQSVVNGVVADDFPVMPAIQGRDAGNESSRAWSINASILKKGLQQVIMAASSDESRPVLTGILLQTTEGHLFAASTDSYRLAEKDLGTNGEDVRLLIPATAIQDLLRILGDYDEAVQVTHDDQQILFQANDVDLVARLIDGKYPDYRKLIPSEFAVEARVKRADLVNVTKVSSLFARESAGSVTINVDADKNELSIRSVASQLGENTAAAAGTIKGTGSITLNSRYLLDALHAFGGEEVSFCFNGKLEPTLLRDPNSDNYAHIIMPLKS
ncbi:MAG TPA: DNA polymerase III subunit beta [Candidatus Saccharimonadales bacterium]|jgi:DNA polymerase-3 subunit beta